MKKKKILFVIGAMGRGGKERRLQVLLQNLSQKGTYDIHVVILKNIIEYRDFMDYKLEYYVINRRKSSFIPALFKLTKIMLKIKPDLIHAWGGLEVSLIAPIALLLNTPIINNEIAYAKAQNKRVYKLWKRINFSLSDYIIANSHSGLMAAKPPSYKSTVIYNGFDYTRFQGIESSFRNELQIPNDAIVITKVAGFRQGKDYDSLLNAAEQISSNISTFFVFVGDGPTREEIQKRCRNRSIGNVLFLGLRNDIENILLGSDIGVLLNDTDISREGLSNSIMEYMAAGLPVIATNAGGNPELVVQDETGFLIENKDIRQLTDCLYQLVTSSEMRKKMGNKGRERIKNKFSLESFVEKHKAIIERFTR